MSQRVVRINELIKREISQFLHTRYQAETVSITITEVSIAPDLRQGIVYYAVLGGPVVSQNAGRFFAKYGNEIRREVGRQVVLKFLPKFFYREDESIGRGVRINAILDDLGYAGPPAPPTPEAAAPAGQEPPPAAEPPA